MAINCFVPFLLGIINTTVYAHVCRCVWHVASSQDPPVLKHTEYGQTCSLQDRQVLKMDRHRDTCKCAWQPPLRVVPALQERRHTREGAGERLEVPVGAQLDQPPAAPELTVSLSDTFQWRKGKKDINRTIHKSSAWMSSSFITNAFACHVHYKNKSIYGLF